MVLVQFHSFRARLERNTWPEKTHVNVAPTLRELKMLCADYHIVEFGYPCCIRTMNGRKTSSCDRFLTNVAASSRSSHVRDLLALEYKRQDKPPKQGPPSWNPPPHPTHY